MFFNKIYKSWKKIQFEKYKFIIKDILNFVEDNSKILDLGCGPMYLEEFLKENKIKLNLISTDIKIPENIISLFILSNGEELPFKNNIFDLILSFDSTHLFNTYDIHRILKSNGMLIISLPLNISNRVEKINGLKLIEEKEFFGMENEIFKFYSKL